MPIQDELPTVIRKARYFPELLPFLHAQDLAAGDNSIITLTSPTLSQDIPVLTDKFLATPNANVLLKLKADREATHELETISLNARADYLPVASGALPASDTFKWIAPFACTIIHVTFHNYAGAPYTAAGSVTNAGAVVVSSSATLAADTIEEKEGADLANTEVAENAAVNFIAGDQTSFIVVTIARKVNQLTPLEFLSTRSLSLVLNADAIVTDYKMYLGIWVVKPSVAEKLLWGLPLSSEDKALSLKRGISDSVEKGILPFPIPYQIEREFIALGPFGKRTYAEIVANVVSGQTTPSITISPMSDEVLVLESVTGDNAALTLANNAQIYVTRDDDRDYLKLPVFAMDQAYDFPCWIPALRKLEIGYYADANLANRYIRVVIGRYKLSELIKARFGQPATVEAIEAAKAGVIP